PPRFSLLSLLGIGYHALMFPGTNLTRQVKSRRRWLGRHDRTRRQSNHLLFAGSLAGAGWLLLAVTGFPSAALAAAGRITLVSDGVPRTAIFVQHRRLKQARRPAVIILRGGREKGARLRRIFG